MLKKLMISAAVSALMASGALAQAGMSPKADAPKAETPKAETPKAAPADAAKFIQAQGTDQLVFSKFKGTSVLGPDDAHIGNVSDMLFDRNGKVLGLIVGVGGFLGIGEKSVAIDMGAFNVVPASTGSSTTGAGGSASSGSDDPTNVKLKVTWTKDQLKAAPDFQYYKPPSRTTSSGPGGTTGMAPRPMPPSGQRQ